MCNYVSYFRVSTQKQGESGLGLQSQKNTVNNFIKSNDNIVMEFQEIESGKKNNRIELNKAIEYCLKNDCTLLIAKLDRLSRNASFVMKLRDSKINFTCCDMPDANTLTIGIFALLAQQERELISDRTKKALSEKKKNGFILGKPENFSNELRLKGRIANHNKAKTNENNIRAYSMIIELRKQNLSLRQIANKLNDNGFKTSNNNKFYANSVIQIENLFTKKV